MLLCLITRDGSIHIIEECSRKKIYCFCGFDELKINNSNKIALDNVYHSICEECISQYNIFNEPKYYLSEIDICMSKLVCKLFRSKKSTNKYYCDVIGRLYVKSRESTPA